MPLYSSSLRPKAVGNVLPSAPIFLAFLAPALYQTPNIAVSRHSSRRNYSGKALQKELDDTIEGFFAGLFYASKCSTHQKTGKSETNQHGRRLRLALDLSEEARSLRKSSCCQSRHYSSKARSLDTKHGSIGTGKRKQNFERFSYHGDVEGDDDDFKHEIAAGFFDHRVRSSESQSRSPAGQKNQLEGIQAKKDDIGAREGWGQPEVEVLQRSLEETPQMQEARGKVLKSLKDLELKINQAKQNGKELSTQASEHVANQPTASPTNNDAITATLSKENYMNMVDLYYYTNKSRFSPDSPDSSPTPSLIDEYSFKLSADTKPQKAQVDIYDDYETSDSPLKQVEEMLKSRQMREILLTQNLVDLLLDDTSSNRALFEAYRELPDPGVAFIPRSAIRILLQRMSTPWTRSQKSTLRYLSLIDDMQKARIPMTRSEWSSAIYLAGRAFARTTEEELASAFRLWRSMEQKANVKASHVTFNILFDIAVRAEKIVVAESLLQEMHDRGLRLNRFGRVSLMYYHGLRGDGDGVRKTYRDFIDAGEIVDTVVLNCVIVSLIQAQEPSAAEQVYERMKSLQERLRQGPRTDDDEILFKRYPSSDSTVLGHDIASNSLGRILIRSARIRDLLPQHHAALQNKMPLTPDHITFRSMISYHANKSGNLDRIAVLMNEMTDLFDLPFQTLHFQLLFKGFALHGASRDPDTTWNSKRLDMVWDACRNSIKASRDNKTAAKFERHELDLPPIRDLDTLADDDIGRPIDGSETSPHSMRRRKIIGWYKLVSDLAGEQESRSKAHKTVHSQQFLDENQARENNSVFSERFFPSDRAGRDPKHSPDQQEQHYYSPTGSTTFDQEEGEYTLPSPTQSIKPNNYNESISLPDEADTGNDNDEPRSSSVPHAVNATRPLICWLLRAYTRCTGSRAKVEEVWNSARKLWKPNDMAEREGVIRVLRRCLRDCDRYGPHSF